MRLWNILRVYMGVHILSIMFEIYEVYLAMDRCAVCVCTNLFTFHIDVYSGTHLTRNFRD